MRRAGTRGDLPKAVGLSSIVIWTLTTSRSRIRTPEDSVVQLGLLTSVRPLCLVPAYGAASVAAIEVSGQTLPS